MRSLGLGNSARPSTGPGATLATASAVGGETVVLPLVARNRVIGMLTLGKPTEEHFRQEILELAEDLSRRAALALDNARLYSERTAISQSLQRSLLPPELPVVPGVEVEVIYRAAGEGNEVGGDFYDLFPIRDGAYGFAIGDVCGTGLEAAAVTGLARHALRLLAREGFGGPAVLERLNAAILDEGARSRFLTLLYGELWPQDDGSALLKVVCAGHPSAPAAPGRHGRAAAEPQPLLGVMDDLELYEQTVTLDPGDVLLCVTDGVTERREGARMLGDDGLTDVLTTCTGLTAAPSPPACCAPWNASPPNRPPTTWPSSPCASPRSRRADLRGAAEVKRLTARRSAPPSPPASLRAVHGTPARRALESSPTAAHDTDHDSHPRRPARRPARRRQPDRPHRHLLRRRHP